MKLVKELKGGKGRSEYAQGMTPERAEQIAEIYFQCDQDRLKIGQALGTSESVPLEWMTHPWVTRRILAIATEMRRSKVYTREEHLRKLQEIRDLALADENYKVGLAAETQLGKAAGLYEKLGTDDGLVDGKALPAPKELSSAQIQARLAQISGRGLPAPEQRASRQSGEEGF